MPNRYLSTDHRDCIVQVPFNRPYMTGDEFRYMSEAQAGMHLSGDGAFSRRCHAWLETTIGCKKSLLTHSCTAALEMAALLLNLKSGDEVIMPSFTFVSTANAFVLRGGVPVFVDIRSDTLNIDERLIEAAITSRTRAICVVHYAGVACEMDAIMTIAEKHGICVIEDAAHAILSSYKGRMLGSIGHLSAFSFHETKNIISGEGGALLINDARFVERAEIVREKGTDRSRFFRGEVDKYSWVDIGSSYLPSELTAAFLYAQLQKSSFITQRRLAVWNHYRTWFEHLPSRMSRSITAPRVPKDCGHNGHMFYLLLPDSQSRSDFISALRRHKVQAVSHYLPLHSSVAGKRYGRSHGRLDVTDSVSDRLVRMPIWLGVESCMEAVLDAATFSVTDAMASSRERDSVELAHAGIVL